MKNRELIVPLCLNNGLAAETADPASFAADCENRGADAFWLTDFSEEDSAHEASIALIRKISRSTDLPLWAGGRVKRLEDVKKLIYAGCRKVVLDFSKENERELAPDAAARFGPERLIAYAQTEDELLSVPGSADFLGGVLTDADSLKSAGEILAGTGLELILSCRGSFDESEAEELLAEDSVRGLSCQSFSKPGFAFMETKYALKDAGIALNCYTPSVGFDELKTGENGLVPVVVQDYKTREVLMLAYMNGEAFEATVRSGRMTYFSRSRQKLWVKGETSGHFQYLRELRIDCDNDTLLARVVQIGAACHTGNRSCFYRSVLKKEFDGTDPLHVFEDVSAVIEDRKEHPKEGSYTNYLFDKGIDKILKKVGEEAAEIVIAAKNPDQEELIYEISDFLYHLMVLMSERGLDWQDITRELSAREN